MKFEPSLKSNFNQNYQVLKFLFNINNIIKSYFLSKSKINNTISFKIFVKNNI